MMISPHNVIPEAAERGYPGPTAPLFRWVPARAARSALLAGMTG